MRYFIFFFFFVYSFLNAQQTQFPFIENLGQWESVIDYKVQQSNHTIFIEKEATWTIVLSDQEKYNLYHDTKHLSIDHSEYIMDYFAYKIQFVNGDFSQNHTGKQSEAYSNYFIGNNISKHKSNVYSYQSITYNNVWPHIDLVVYMSESHQFKYDFILNKGAKPSDIQLKYEGPECLTLENGELIINGSFSLLKEQLPITYIKSSQQQIPCQYILKNNTISFNLGIDLITEPIVIDPVLVAATASGSTGNNFGHTAGYDLDGNIYSGGISFVTGYPTNSGSYQQNFPNSTCTAINKLNPTGSTLFYSTYLGGTNGTGNPVSLACTNSNKLVILGTTYATDFPTTTTAFQTSNGGASDITVSILSENGSALLGSTYLGGSLSDGRAYLNTTMNFTTHDPLKGTVNIANNEIVCIATVTSNDIVGVDYSNSAPLSPTNSDAIVFKMDTTLSNLLHHKLIGGSQHERGYGLTVDQNQNVYICGSTLSSDLVTTSGVYQESNLSDSTRSSGFITKLTPNLNTILLSSYLSTPASTTASKGIGNYFISLDNQENIYVYGLDKGHNLPQVGGGYSFGDGYIYIAKFDSNLGSLLVTNRMADGINGELGAFKVDNCNRILFSNYGNSSFSTTPDHILPSGGMFVGALSSGGQNLDFGTYYTGGHVDGGTSQFSDQGNIYHAVCVNGNTFNCMPNAYSQNIMNAYDCKVFKIDPELEPIEVEITNTWPNMQFCPNMTHQFGISSSGGLITNLTWYYDGIPVDTNSPELNLTFSTPGVHVIKIIGESECIQYSEDSVVVEVFEIDPEFISDTVHCVDEVLQFTDQSIIPPNYISNISDWFWEFGDGQTSTQQNPTHSYAAPGLYDISLTVYNSDSCEFTISKALHVEIFDVELDFEVDTITCLNNAVNFTSSVQIPNQFETLLDGYYWDFGDGNSSTEENPSHTYDNLGQYDVTLQVSLDNGCTYSITHNSSVSVVELTIDMTLLTDSIWYPFNTPIVAYTNGTNYDSLQWFVNDEFISNEEKITFHAETEESIDYVTIKLIGWLGNCEAVVIKKVKLTNFEDINIPNAFTPNGDGTNDVFNPIGRQVENAEYYMFKIHNRWGEQVFYTNDNTEGWNGLNKRGEAVKADVYIWHLELQSPLSGHQSFNGWVKLIK